jgi:uncharacterized alkaline shock family protein YloU
MAVAERAGSVTREARLPDDRLPGQALATRRAVTDVVRMATLSSYGVVGVGGTAVGGWLGALLGRATGVRISLAGNRIEIDLRLQVAQGVPIAEVARQVDSAVRFGIRRAFHRDVDRLSIRVASLSGRPASEPPAARPESAVGPGQLADSGTDVA